MVRPLHPFLYQLVPLMLLAIGCGSPGAPAPPSLNLATPIQDLSASRTADSVHLSWTMPSRTTDRVVITHAIHVEICRKSESGQCTAVATLALGPGKAGSYTDALPANLVHGSPRLLVYEIYLRNHAQKSAGASNSAFTASGPAPPMLAGLTAEVRREGVLLSWHPAGTSMPRAEAIVFRIHRLLIQSEAAQLSRQAPGPKAAAGEHASLAISKTPTPAVTLAVHTPDAVDPGHALDTDAQANQRYRYTVERVAAITLSGHSVEVQGEPSEPVIAETTDVFPPAVPRGLAAVADVTGGAIDLSWSPNTDSDLAGYFIYRRDLEAALPRQRISPAGVPVIAPAFRDAGVERGHTYAYSVSAIDQNGNESAPSNEVKETLPARSEEGPNP